MNVTELTEALHTKINTATNLQEILALTKAIERLNLGSPRTVATYADLLVLDALDGEVVFVEDESSFYYFLLFWSKITNSFDLLAWSWGEASSGQLGDNTVANKSSPVSVVGGFTDWIQIVSTTGGTVGLRANRTAWAWGASSSGQLGDNSTTDKSSPVSVVGGFTDWVQVSANAYQRLGVRETGTIWGWGRNNFGQLGDNSTLNRSSPVSVVGGFADWIQVSVGELLTLGLRSNGTVWAWGNNLNGVLGDNTTVAKSSPVSVVGGITDWVQVSAGGHCLGIRANGTAWGWGRNSQGQLGDNTSVVKSSPVSVVGGFTDWTQLSAGNFHSIGIRANGTAWAWGYNANGQLGDNTVANKSSPVSVVGGFTDWVQISTSNSSHGVKTNGTLWSWGRNNVGQLGDNTVANKSSPVSVVGGVTDWVQVTGGTTSAAAIRSLLG